VVNGNTDGRSELLGDTSFLKNFAKSHVSVHPRLEKPSQQTGITAIFPLYPPKETNLPSARQE
jgi:hypothetical protein